MLPLLARLPSDLQRNVRQWWGWGSHIVPVRHRSPAEAVMLHDYLDYLHVRRYPLPMNTPLAATMQARHQETLVQLEIDLLEHDSEQPPHLLPFFRQHFENNLFVDGEVWIGYRRFQLGSREELLEEYFGLNWESASQLPASSPEKNLLSKITALLHPHILQDRRSKCRSFLPSTH